MRKSQRATDLRLKAIGKQVHTKPSRLNESQSKITSKHSLFESQMLPQSQNLEQINRKTTNKKRMYSAIEDPRISRFSHSKILLVQKNLLILTMLILFLGMVKVETDVINGQTGAISTQIMLVMDLITLFLMLLIIFRKLLIIQLCSDQRKIYMTEKQKKVRSSIVFMLLRHSKMKKQLLLELILVMPHPTQLLTGLTYSYFDQNRSQELVFTYNDFMSALMLIKTYLIIRSIVALTIFASPRATRICNHSGIENDFFFSIKCLAKQYSIRCTMIIFLISVTVFSFGFRVTEGKVSALNNTTPNGFQQLGNCYWCTFITMSTLGYGEYALSTIHGKILAVITAILGVVLSSQLVVALGQYLEMKVSEVRSHTTLERLQQNLQLKQTASIALSQSIKIADYIKKNSADPFSKQNLKPLFEQLKKKIDLAKAKHKHIKSIIPSENITQEMIRSFELIKDNLVVIYHAQTKVKRKIEQIEGSKNFKQQDVKKNFLNEVRNIMNNLRSS